MRADLTEHDPVNEAVVSRGGMFIIGFIFIGFSALIYLLLSSALQDIVASAGDANDAWNFLLFFVATFASLPIVAALKHLFLPDEKKTLLNEISHQFSIFSVTRKDWAKQLKHALLMWLVVFVPLDLISYLMPGMLEYQTISLTPSTLYPLRGLYLTLPIFGSFLGYSILIHLFVATREETLYRGVIQFWGQQKAGVTSAMIISATAFGLGHFSYWFTPEGQLMSVWYPIYWGGSGLFIGLMLSFYLRTTGHLLPMILAHWWNNVVSTIAVWTFIETKDAITTMTTLGYVLYLPLILCGVILAIIWRRTIGKGATLVKKEISSYRKQPPYIIFLDILFGLGIWFVLLLLG